MAAGPWYTTWSPWNTVIWCANSDTRMWYSFETTVASLSGIQPVVPLGRWGSSTRIHPGWRLSIRNTCWTGRLGSSFSGHGFGSVSEGAGADGSGYTSPRLPPASAINREPGGSLVGGTADAADGVAT